MSKLTGNILNYSALRFLFEKLSITINLHGITSLKLICIFSLLCNRKEKVFHDRHKETDQVSTKGSGFKSPFGGFYHIYPYYTCTQTWIPALF